ncbi:hypothetical protein K3758_01120 [Sulfitobacter sp. W002]|uniref:Rap1a/Tai family immunity protein n=1 Tax=Sulfitobacter sp. W002 TaxID=2867024 RepID=UPI0021A6AE96|nr:Rap1a/Tai family immunity protein [Sulfitobacter sp. W002]UWR30176.1 hypothetical protein K3758_01120 [Sulfitobacter sp. W002]
MASTPLTAQTATGNEIAAACEYLNEADVRTGYCIGYIIGAWEGLKLGAFQMLLASGADGTAQELDNAINNLLGICVPATVERGQIIDIAMKYFDENPEERHLPARGLIRDALRISFPAVELGTVSPI